MNDNKWERIVKQDRNDHILCTSTNLVNPTRVKYQINEYDNLMTLLFDQLGEEWGDCKGRAWCGTCHIEIWEGTVDEVMHAEEKNTLSKLPNSTSTNRLACQLPADEKLADTPFHLLKD